MSSAAEQQALTNPSQLQPGYPLDGATEEARGPRKSQNLKLGFLKLDGLQHILRLRSRVQLSDKLFAEVGADMSLKNKAIYPRTALEYRVHKKDNWIATLRADRRALYIQKSFPVNIMDKVTCRLQTTAATSYQGVPELSVGLEQVKPPWLMAVGALALFAAGKTVTGSRTFGGTSVQIPVVGHDSNLKGEVKAAVTRNGKKFALALQQLNGIIRV